MFGLVISRAKDGDVIKVASNMNKLYSLILDEVESWTIQNKSALNKNKKAKEDLKLVKDALMVKDFDSALDLFTLVTEHCNNCVIMSTAPVEIITDS